jgi:iron complex outermembrane receptor protein
LPNPAGTSQSLCKDTLSVQQSYVPWTVGLDYKPDPNAMLYAKVSQGYRAGALPLYGPQPLNSVGAPWGPVAPESLLSPEIGGKFDLLDHKLQINAAGYFSHYTNVQAEINTGLGYGFLLNSGTLNIWGGELEVVGHLQKLELDGELGYTNPEYTRSSFSYGQPAVNIAKLNWSITATYPIETSAGVLTLTGTYSYRSSEQLYTNIVKPLAAFAPGITQPGFGLLDARASFRLANAPITLTLYGQNLTNQKYFVAASQYGAPELEVMWPGPPLTFGGSIKYSF